MPTATKSKFTGNPGSVSYPIGKMHVPAGTHHNASYETASWWTDSEYDAQDVVLWSNGYYVSYGVTARVTASYFGPYGHPTDPGTETRVSWLPYLYDFFRNFCENPAVAERVTLLPEYTAEIEHVAKASPMPSYADADTWDPMHHFGRLYVEGDHPIQVSRDWSAHAMVREFDMYNVWVRGVEMAKLEISSRRGYNGDTYQVAIRDAVLDNADVLFGV